jgi:hypothetical protein
MDQAQKADLVKQRRDFASNTLVVVVPTSSARVPKAVADLALPAYARIAIGLPASVPVGRYTRACSRPPTCGADRAEDDRRHNVRQALDYVARAEVDAAFVYATDAALMPGQGEGRVHRADDPTDPLSGRAAGRRAERRRLRRGFVELLFTPPAQAGARPGYGISANPDDESRSAMDQLPGSQLALHARKVGAAGRPALNPRCSGVGMAMQWHGWQPFPGPRTCRSQAHASRL